MTLLFDKKLVEVIKYTKSRLDWKELIINKKGFQNYQVHYNDNDGWHQYSL